MALRAINYDPNLAGGQRTLRAITLLPPRTPDNRISENRPPDTRTPRILDNNPPETRPHDNRLPDTQIHDNRTHNIPLPGGAT